MPSRRQQSTYGRSGRSGPGGSGRSRRTRPPSGSASDEAPAELPDAPGAGFGLPDGPGRSSGLPDAPDAPDAPEAAAREICLRLLTFSPRTRAQLADALRQRHIPDSAAEAVLDRYTEAGLIDDPAFARAWVESRHHGRGLSRRALSAELRRRGVADGDVHEAVELVDPGQEVATARQLIARRVAATRGQPPEARVRKLMGVLARKGYGAGLAYRVVREALEAEGADGAEAAEIVGELTEPDPDISSEDAAW